MSGAAAFTIYKLVNRTDDFEGDCKYIISEYNKSSKEGLEYKPVENKESALFEHISGYQLYTGIKSGPPEWKAALESIASGLDGLTNRHVSFVLFIECQGNRFCVTGGSGRFVVSSSIDYYFGLDILSRVLDDNESYIKETRSRYMAGNQVIGQSQFNQVVTIESTRTLTNYFKQVNSFLPKEKIEEYFGIDLKNGRNEYKFLASDSIKLGKALTVRQLDTVLNKLCILLEKAPRIAINHIRPIRQHDLLSNKLDNKLNEILIDRVENQKSNHQLRFVLPTYNVDYFELMTVNKHKVCRLDNFVDEDVFNYCDQKFSSIAGNPEKNYVEHFLKNAKIIGGVVDAIIFEMKLYDCLEVAIEMTEQDGDEQETKLYWLMDGEWFFYEETMKTVINREFRNKVSQAAPQSAFLEQMKPWLRGDEGEYNFNHQSIENMFVLDKILVNNVEMCDLLFFENNKIYFIHVKDGLNRDVRVLCNQILNAMNIVQLAKTSGKYEALEDYYTSIMNKIGVANSQESKLSKAARKFREKFPTSHDFSNNIGNRSNEINFVFAFRPGSSHNLEIPSSITSFPAKFSMIYLVEETRKFDLKLEFKKITNA